MKLEELKKRYFKFGFPGTCIEINADTITSLLSLSRDLSILCEAQQKILQKFSYGEEDFKRIMKEVQQIYKEKNK